MRQVVVPLGDREYPIWIGSQLLARLGELCRDAGLGGRCAIVSDSNVAPRYGAVVENSLQGAGIRSRTFTVPAGERSKSLATMVRGYEAFARQRLERQSFVLALGGGVVGDVAGFLAATYLRGVRYVQVPTSLLAQVDSSVGGKVGVNLRAGKNLVGAFHQPSLVVCDLDTLRTLPAREFRAGLAEVIKYGIIADVRLFGRLERELPRLLQRNREVLGRVVARCCQIKADIVAADETETGLRAILNFGHTIGHGLETISRYRWLHGEAIAIGQVAAARLSARSAGLTEPEVERIRRLFARAGLPTLVRLSPPQNTALLAAMRQDKKNRNGEIQFVLANRLGRATPGHRLPDSQIQEVLGSVSRTQRARAPGTR